MDRDRNLIAVFLIFFGLGLLVGLVILYLAVLVIQAAWS